MTLDARSRSWDDPDVPRDRRFLKALGAGIGSMLLFAILAQFGILPVSSYEAGQMVAKGLAVLVLMLIALAFVKRPIPFWGHWAIFVAVWVVFMAI
jgi:hypothetical protein